MSIFLIYYSFMVFFSVIFFLFSMWFMIIDYSLLMEFEFVSVNSCSILMTILLDWMSLLFMSFVLYISSMVVFYSEEYMEGDINMNRFILLVFMFVLSMLLMIISPNLISILLGWDGLGLISYCLVIYYQNVKSFNAGMITILMNRVGDVGLLVSIIWMMNFGSFNYIFLDYMRSYTETEYICFLVVLAALTKSAQIPFSYWLPMAMAAPTPVSALVHSSTLVTAGIYLLIRFNFLFSSKVLLVLLFIGSMTMFMSGLGANFEYDLKKIIALSTLSQLGLMIMILSLGEYKLAFFHLLMHALFKALLFMCAGSIIHNLGNFQDIRYMGGLLNHFPLTCSFFVISNLSLCGLPFLSGFYSKDLILGVFSMSYLSFFIFVIFYLSLGFTVTYTFRLIYYVVVGDFNYLVLNKMSDCNFIMLKGMGGMIYMVVIGGALFMWLLFEIPYFICLPNMLKILILMVIMIGVWISYELSKFFWNYSLKSFKILKSSIFFYSMWNMMFISTYGVCSFPLYLGYKNYSVVDQGWSEYFGSQNIFYSMKSISVYFQFLYNNNLKIFFLLMVMWLIFLFLYI